MMSIFLYMFTHDLQRLDLSAQVAQQYSCQSSVMLFLLGSLEQRQDVKDTLAQIKPFICSKLYRIKDFREVRKMFSLSILFQYYLSK